MMNRIKEQLIRDPYGWPLSVFCAGYGIGQFLVTVFAGHRAPYSVEVLLPVVLTVLWVCAIGAGGITAIFGKLSDHPRWEASGFIMMVGGLAIYAASNITVGNPLTAGALTCLAIGAAINLQSILSHIRVRKIVRTTDRS